MLLDEDEIKSVSAPLGTAQTLPPTAYRSADVFSREADQIFYKEWICVARVEQLPNPGDYLRVDVLRQPLILARQPDDTLHAMSALCAHRSMPLITEGGNATHFQCPYHLWRYDSLGNLVSKPLMADVEVPEDCRLPTVRVETWQGFVFVNLDADAAPLGPRLGPLDAIVAPYRMQDMVWVSSTQWDCPWNWKLLVENFMEAYHHLGPHGQSLQPDHAAADSYSSGDIDDGWSVLHMPSRTSPEELDILASVIMPSFCWANAPGGTGAFWYQLLPESHDRMSLILHTLMSREIADSPRPGRHCPGYAGRHRRYP